MGEETRGKEKLKKSERFVCVCCAFIWKTTEYSEPEKFRQGYLKIKARCPICGVATEKPIEIEPIQ